MRKPPFETAIIERHRRRESSVQEALVERPLLSVPGIAPRDVRRLYLAGGFGMRLSLAHAIGCGLLPGFAPEQVEVVGNTSLGGAYLAMNDRTLLDEMEGARRRFEAVELNLQPGLEDAYIDNLSLP